MEKTRPKINAKQFVEDFRSGKSDEELMVRHGLDEKALKKVLRILVERKLLDESELLMAGHSFHAVKDQESRPPVRAHRESQARPAERPTISGVIVREDTTCPQCGAPVTKRVLTCPECGHVLPGEERWENVEPKKSLGERIPPKVWGIIMSVPIAVMLFFIFKDFIIPVAGWQIEKQRDSLQSELDKREEPWKAARELAQQRGAKVVQVLVERLIDQEILQSVEPDYSTFVAGRRWNDISTIEKERHLSEIRSALTKANLNAEFDLTDQHGGLLATVKTSSISIGGFEEGSEDVATPQETPQRPSDSEAAKDFLRQRLERRLAPEKSLREP